MGVSPIDMISSPTHILPWDSLSAAPPGLSPVITTFRGEDLISRSRPKDSSSLLLRTTLSMVQTPASSLQASPFLQRGLGLEPGRPKEQLEPTPN